MEEIRSFFKCNTAQPLDLNKNKAEAFIKMLVDMPNFELRIDAMLFIEEFYDIFRNLSDKFEIFSKCSKSILKSESLKKFIRLVLAAGNYINNVRVDFISNNRIFIHFFDCLCFYRIATMDKQSDLELAYCRN
jgi:hypothetical protein